MVASACVCVCVLGEERDLWEEERGEDNYKFQAQWTKRMMVMLPAIGHMYLEELKSHFVWFPLNICIFTNIDLLSCLFVCFN